MMPSPLAIALLCLSVIVSSPALSQELAVQVATLDGQQHRGSLTSWNDKGIVLSTEQGELSLDFPSLLALSSLALSPNDSAATRPVSQGDVRMTDGSVIPISTITSDNKQASFTVDARVANDANTQTADLKKIQAIRLLPLDDSGNRLWNQLCKTQSPADVVVIRRRGSGSLDHLQGVLGKLTDSHLFFNYEGEEIPIKRSKVAGIIYYRQPIDSANDSATGDGFVIEGVAGMKLVASRIKPVDSQMSVTLRAGPTLAIDWSAVASIDFSAGKLRYLSDLTPAQSEWTPLIALPAQLQLARLHGQPRFDQSFLGEPLRLCVASDSEDGAPYHEQTFSKGIALRSRTELAFRIPRGFHRFRCLCGIDPTMIQQGDVELTIEADGTVLLDTAIHGDDPPLEIDLPLGKARILRIRVDYGNNLDTGDLLHLCDAVLLK